jgi:hypothetical protein
VYALVSPAEVSGELLKEFVHRGGHVGWIILRKKTFRNPQDHKSGHQKRPPIDYIHKDAQSAPPAPAAERSNYRGPDTQKVKCI